MSDPFDDRFADRVREAFDAYDEPVDEAELARTLAAVRRSAPPAARRAADRPSAARPLGRRRRGAVLVAVAALAVTSGLWLQAPRTDPDAAPPSIVSAPEGGAVEAELPDTEAEPPALAAQGGARSADAGAAPPRRATAPPGAGGVGEGTPPAATDRTGPPPPAPAAASVAEPAPPETVAAPPVAQAEAGEGGVVDPVEPAGPSVFSLGGEAPVAPAPPAAVAERGGAGRSGLQVVASASAVSGGAVVEGAGASVGLAREWAVGHGLSLSGGAAVAVNRIATEPDADAVLFSALAPEESQDVVARTTLTTLAVEVPVDLAADLARVPGGRLGVSVGLTSVLYLGQTFDDEGRTFAGRLVADPTGGEMVVLTSEPFAGRETVGPLGRLDLARQLNVALRLTSRGGGAALDLYGRLPLGGVTSRDLPLTALGVRLRYGL